MKRMVKDRKKRGSKAGSTGSELERLFVELLDEANTFLGLYQEVSEMVAEEDYRSEVNAMMIATVQLRALMRSFRFKYDDTAESIDLCADLNTLASAAKKNGVLLVIPRTLPSLHLNRRRLQSLLSSLIEDATRAGATKIEVEVTRSGRFRFIDNRPRSNHRKGSSYFDLTCVDGNGELRPNLDLFIAQEIVKFYGGEIVVHFSARSVEVEFSLAAPRKELPL
jgi:hypothetical protein